MAFMVTLSVFSWLCIWGSSLGEERNSLKPGDLLDGSSILYSPKRTFFLKFEPVEPYSRFTYLIIGHSDTSTEVEVDTNHGYKSWIANRNDPIPNNSGFLTLDYSGALRINCQNGKPITLYSPSKFEFTNNTILTLSESGNLILQELHPNGDSKNVLWQSFDRPSDILLPGMKLGVNYRTGQSWSVTASVSDADPAAGSFTLEWDPSKQQLIITRQGKVYWASGLMKHKRFVNIPEQVQKFYKYKIVSNEDEDSFSYTSEYDRSQWVLYHNGQLWDTRGSDFSIARVDTCYGYNTEGGCQKWEQPKCRKPGDTFQIKYGYLDHPSGSSSFDKEDRNTSLGESDCRATCWANCTCFGFKSLFPNGTGCMYYYGEWVIARVFTRDASINIFAPYDSDHKGTGPAMWRKIGLVIAASVTIICLGIFYVSRRRKTAEVLEDARSREGNEILKLGASDKSTIVSELQNDVKKGNLRAFSYASIMAATNTFSPENMLGKGGFGPVYKGLLPSGEEIAIKRLSRDSTQGVIEFKNELFLISELQHMNLVQLSGCCIYGEERMLIYEFMPNKSLDFFLFDSTHSKLLDWKRRFNIIEGIAQGLLYLHKYSRLKVVHRDLKASNILLDGNMHPKISDFGMAKIFTQESNLYTNRIVGTYGYMSPEYAMEGIFSIKSDVYSFGVLLLEIISGKRNNSFHNSQNPLNLIGQAWELWKEGQSLDLVDPILRDSFNQDQVLRCIHIGLLCVEENAEDRPTMSEVIALFTNETASLPFPTRPAFYSGRKLNKKYHPNDFETHSTNGLSLTTIGAR